MTRGARPSARRAGVPPACRAGVPPACRAGVPSARRIGLTGVALVVLAGGLATGTPGPAGAATRQNPAAPGTVTGAANGAVDSAGTGALTGTVREIVDESAGGASRKLLQAGPELIPLVPGSLPGAADGDLVRVVLAPGGRDRRVRAAVTLRRRSAAAAGTRGRHDVYVVLVRPKGVATDRRFNRSAATRAVRRAAAYWRSQTGGAVRFRVARVVTPYTSDHRCADGVDQLWTEALERTGVRPAANRHLMVVAPAATARQGCPYGLGSLGSGGGLGLTFVTEPAQSLMAHELGHNLGLHHSGALHCKGAQDHRYRRGRGWPAACRREEYGDLLDVMGYSGASFGEGSLNAANLDRLGLLPRAVKKIKSSGRYRVRLAPLSARPNARRAVRIMERSGQVYYVEFRTNAGRDKAARRNRLRPALGVRVLRRNPTRATGALVLDATPSRRNDYANNLAAGRRFRSASGKLTVKVLKTGRSGATIEIVNRR